MLFAEQSLHKIISLIITAAGSSEEETRIIADPLVRTNLTGHSCCQCDKERKD